MTSSFDLDDLKEPRFKIFFQNLILVSWMIGGGSNGAEVSDEDEGLLLDVGVRGERLQAMETSWRQTSIRVEDLGAIFE